MAEIVNREAFGIDQDRANQIVATNMALPGSVEVEQECEDCGEVFDAPEGTSFCPDCELA